MNLSFLVCIGSQEPAVVVRLNIGVHIGNWDSGIHTLAGDVMEYLEMCAFFL